MKRKTFITGLFSLLFFIWTAGGSDIPVSAVSSGINNAEESQAKAVEVFVSGLVVAEDALIPPALQVPDNLPPGFSIRHFLPDMKRAYIGQIVSKRYCYFHFVQPKPYHDSPPIYIANRLLLI